LVSRKAPQYVNNSTPAILRGINAKTLEDLAVVVVEQAKWRLGGRGTWPNVG